VGDLVCISHLRWDFVWQRPQHLLSRLSRKHRILFVEEPIASTDETTARLDIIAGQGAPNVTVIRLIQPVQQGRWIGHGNPLTQQTYSDLLNQYLKSEGYVKPCLWLYTPMASEFTDTIDHDLLIVDVMDQLSAFRGAPIELIEREQAVLRQADLVFTGGVSLYRDKLPFNPNTYLFPSGVEVEHYAPAARREAFERPTDLDGIQGPILGYFGVIDERMDLDLLAHLAQAQPDWQIVMLGPVVKIAHEDLPQAHNLHYLGMKKYEELPAYLAYFDVAMIPFAMNEATQYLSPTKTLEYMAAHKPVVSNPINDVIELYGEVVRIAYSPEEFTQHVREALASAADGKERKVKEQALLKKYRWDYIAEQMNNLINNAIKASPSQQQVAGSMPVGTGE
jgi:UDP-galactopyranose mutase